MSDEVVTFVEIDLDTCIHRFGEGLCTATLSAGTPRKCVNTFKTCAIPGLDVYTPETATVTLTPQGQSGLPMPGRNFACLLSVKESEQTVNLAGSDPKLDALGRRASVKIKAADFVYDARFLDPYFDERISGAAQFSGIGYEPVGTFWQGLRGRDPYFAGYPIRINRGRVVAGALVTDRTTHYIASEFNPTNGSAEWVGVDVLDLAANDRAVCPRPSAGQLLEPLPIDGDTLTLTPEGVGEEYGASGWVVIGGEIIAYASRTGEVLSGLSRGQLGTEAEEHDAADAVQEAWRYTGPAYLALNKLLTDFAAVPGTWVPLAEWEGEANVWFAVEVDVTVTKSTMVSKLIGELAILGFSLFTDLEAQKIRFRANRPLFPNEAATAPEITDADIIGEPKYDGRDSERLTRVEFRSMQIDPTDELSDNNFLRSQLTIAGDKEDPRAHGDVRYRLEKTRWLNQGAAASIRILAQRYLRRFSTAPERVTVRVKRRKYGSLPLTTVVNLTTRRIPNGWGLIERAQYQIIKRESPNDGEIDITLQRFDYSGTFGFWAPNDAPDYDAATEEQKDVMAFWGPNTGDTFADGRPLYKWS